MSKSSLDEPCSRRRRSAIALRFQLARFAACATFLLHLFRLLDEHDVNYCVLHSWDCLPENLTSDLDLAVHPRDKHKLPAGLRTLARKKLCLLSMPGSFHQRPFFVFCWTEASGVKTAAVDLVFDHRRSGLILATSEEMLEGRKRHGEFWIPSEKVEFAYSLGKKILERQNSRTSVHSPEAVGRNSGSGGSRTHRCHGIFRQLQQAGRARLPE